MSRADTLEGRGLTPLEAFCMRLRFALTTPVLTVLALTVSGIGSAQTTSPPLTAARATAARTQIRHALDVPDQLPALNAKVWSTFSPTPGVLADRVTYTTQDAMLVPAIVYRPDPKVVHWKSKLPGIVIVNGHGGDKFSWYAFYSGMMFAKAGAVVVTYDPIGEGERNSKRQSRDNPAPHDVYPATPPGWTEAQWKQHWGPRVAGLMQTDLAQAVSYLIAQPEVDSKRIAVAGYSMGAFIAGLEGTWDTRVHAVLLSGGGVYDSIGGYFDRNPLPCQSPPYKALTVLGDRTSMIFALQALRGPMYVMNGRDDTVMDIPHHGPDWFDQAKAGAAKLLANNPPRRPIFSPRSSTQASTTARPGWTLTASSGSTSSSTLPSGTPTRRSPPKAQPTSAPGSTPTMWTSRRTTFAKTAKAASTR